MSEGEERLRKEKFGRATKITKSSFVSHGSEVRKEQVKNQKIEKGYKKNIIKYKSKKKRQEKGKKRTSSHTKKRGKNKKGKKRTSDTIIKQRK